MYASGEASQDNCEAYLSFCASNDTLPRTPFTVYKWDKFFITRSHPTSTVQYTKNVRLSPEAECYVNNSV
jgi:hypothetical protein